MAFSKKTKLAAVLAVASGMTLKEAAKKYGANPNSVGAWVRSSKKEIPKTAVTGARRVNRPARVARQTLDSPIALENAKLRHLLVNAMIELTNVQNGLQ